MIRLRPRWRHVGCALNGGRSALLKFCKSDASDELKTGLTIRKIPWQAAFSLLSVAVKAGKNFKLPLPPASQGRITPTPSRSRWVKTLRSRGFGVRLSWSFS
jgi:hypothetical protein